MEDKQAIKIKLSTIIAIGIILILIIGLLIAYIYYLKAEMNDKEESYNEVVETVDEDKEHSNENTIADEDKKEDVEYEEVSYKDNIEVVPTMKDTISQDSSWCATFQLIWNDLVNEIAHGDIIFNPQEKIAENLNKQEFTESMISEEYYYKKYGFKTLELKEEIEKGIKEKFNQKSDILENFDWSEDALDNPNGDARRYFLYTMLYREFEFLKEFDKLEKADFGKKYHDVEYFGIKNSTDKSVKNQIKVLYYNSDEDFAILINTKSNDEVIFYKNPEGNDFETIYKNMNEKAEKYEGSTSLGERDLFKAPVIKFNQKREYDEVEGKMFTTPVGPGMIVKALQTIEFELDNKGGRIKSEAGMDVVLKSSMSIDEEKPRHFYLDDTFALFLREKGKDKPYFATRIDDITKFQ